MLKQITYLITYLTIALILWGCSQENNPLTKSSNCELESSYPITFTGEALGYGKISFSPLKDGQQGLEFEIALRERPQLDSPTTFRIKGVGQCTDGAVKGQFASGVSSTPTIKVLGGDFFGIFEHPNIDKPFGKWKISMVDTGQDQTYNLTGFWEHSFNLTASPNK